jgi:3-phosphoshikimate 1-carboxyvinyltransferase
MTIELLKNLGVEIIANNDFEIFTVKGDQIINPFTYSVPGDWSGASFMIVAGAVAGEITVTSLNVNSPQADKKIVDAVLLAGADVFYKENSITVKKQQLKGFVFDATHCPDLFPPLVALAAACKGTSSIAGVHRLTFKESNRKAVLIEEFKNLGVEITVENDNMIVKGSKVKSGTVLAHGDHRIAMAAAVLALISDRAVTIEDWKSIDKSYPDFFNDLNSVLS